MSESLRESSDVTWPATKDAARAAMLRAGEILLALAVSHVEGVIDRIEQEAADPRTPAVDHAVRAGTKSGTAGEVGRDRPGGHGANPGRDGGMPTAIRTRPDESPNAHATGGLSGVLSSLLRRGLRLAGKVVGRLARALARRLDDVVAHGGVKLTAALAAAAALVAGRNPIWAALKGAFSALSTGAKVALIIGLVLAVLLLPVTLLLLLIALIVIIVVLAVKTRSRRS